MTPETSAARVSERVHLDGAPVRVLEAHHEEGNGCCGSCLKRGLVALLIGSAEKGAHRHWVLAKRITPTAFVTHDCKAAAA